MAELSDNNNDNVDLLPVNHDPFAGLGPQSKAPVPVVPPSPTVLTIHPKKYYETIPDDVAPAPEPIASDQPVAKPGQTVAPTDVTPDVPKAAETLAGAAGIDIPEIAAAAKGELTPQEAEKFFFLGALPMLGGAPEKKAAEAVETAAPLVTRAIREAHPGWIDQRFPNQIMPEMSSRKAIDLEGTFGGNEAPRIVDTETMKRNPELFKKNTDLVKDYPNVRPFAGASPTQVGVSFTNQMADNLVWLYNQIPQVVRERSKQWYVGGNKIVNDWAKQYELPDTTVAGMIAALSPQSNWYRNVANTHRMIETLKNDTFGFTPEMDKTLRGIDAFKKDRYSEAVNLIRGKSLQDIDNLSLSPEAKAAAKAMWVRVYDETYNPRAYQSWSPEGESLGEIMKKNDPTQTANMAWTFPEAMAKAIQIYHSDGSRDAINNLMGEQHKIRNFYNNLLDPYSPHKDVTVDTHAVAAANLRPFSGNSLEVAHNFGNTLVKNEYGESRQGSFGSNITGSRGLYPLYADAYRQAAQRLGVLPRELQSITWEGIRGLFPEDWKSTKNSAIIDNIWRQYKSGKVGIDETRQRILDHAAAERPDWVYPDWWNKKPVSGANAGDRGATNAGELSGTGTGTEAGRESTSGVGGSHPAAVPEEEWDLNPPTSSSLMRQLVGHLTDKEIAQREAEASKRHELRVGLSSYTDTIPGLDKLHRAVQNGDEGAAQTLQEIAGDHIRYLTHDIPSLKIEATPARGLYGGTVEPSLGLGVNFEDRDRSKVLGALARFGKNFNQEQIHVRGDVTPGTSTGHVYSDGSYNTSVFRINLKKPLSNQEVQKVIDESGLPGLTATKDYLEAYYVGDPKDVKAISEFENNFFKARESLGSNGGEVEAAPARFWAYGNGEGATSGYGKIARNFRPPEEDQASATTQRVASRLAGYDVKPTPQAETITPAKQAKQEKVAVDYDAMQLNGLNGPDPVRAGYVRRGYNELNREMLSQFDSLPIKVEVWTGKGEPYSSKGKVSSEEMRKDVLGNNHLYIYGTEPSTFGPPGADFKDHPLLQPSGRLDINGRPLLYNDLLRANHDYYAHTMSPVAFGPRGEEAAWENHMKMTLSPWARWALTSETRGQNSWVNFRPEVQGKPLNKRPFAEQKADLLPLEHVLTGDPQVDASLWQLPGGEHLPLNQKYIKAYHSSPHDFDQFDLSKVGTGQGAQTYGHGLYTAENPEVGGHGGQYWDEFSRRIQPGSPEALAFKYLKDADHDRKIATDRMEKSYQGVSAFKNMASDNTSVEDRLYEDHQEQLHKDALDLLKSNKHIGPRAYEVAIKAEPEHFLDWDKPFEEQSSHVKDALSDFVQKKQAAARTARDKILERGTTVTGKPLPPEKIAEYKKDLKIDSGKKLYDMLQVAHGAVRPGEKASEASQYLKERGIPGIRYLDAGSRPGMSNHTVIYKGQEFNTDKDFLKFRDSQNKGSHGFTVDPEDEYVYSTMIDLRRFGNMDAVIKNLKEDASQEVANHGHAASKAFAKKQLDYIAKNYDDFAVKNNQTHNYVLFRDDPNFVKITKKRATGGGVEFEPVDHDPFAVAELSGSAEGPESLTEKFKGNVRDIERQEEPGGPFPAIINPGQRTPDSNPKYNIGIDKRYVERAGGGETTREDQNFDPENPSPGPDFSGDTTQIGKDYPVLQPHLANTVVEQGMTTGADDDRQLEFYHPWDHDNPYPGKNAVQLFTDMAPQDRQQAIAGDLLHHVGAVDPQTNQPVDPTFYALKQQMAASRTPEQIKADDESYAQEASNPNYSTFPRDEWDEKSRVDAYIRAGVFPKQNPEWSGMLTPQQKSIASKMTGYLTGAQQRASGGRVEPKKIDIHGIVFTIEVPKGGTRSGVDKGGKKWSCKMPAAYGTVSVK